MRNSFSYFLTKKSPIENEAKRRFRVWSGSGATMNKCIFPGTFDPITKGHIDICNRISNYFDEVIFLFLENPQKQSMFKLNDRINLAKKALKVNPKIIVETYEGLLADYCVKNNTFAIIRGLRNSSDFNYEMLYNLANISLDDRIQMLFIPTSSKNLHISSSLIREIIKYKGKINEFVPECIISDIERLAGY